MQLSLPLDHQAVIEIGAQVFSDEIEGLNQVKHNLGTSFVAAVELILHCRGKVVVTGIGKSGHIANKIAATLASTGTSAFFVHPAEALHGDLGMISRDDLLVAISFSGESDELAAIVPIVQRKQVKVIALTGNLQSSLARHSDCVLGITISKEACPLNLAPTTSTTATLVLGDALAVALLSLRQFKPEDFAMSHPGGSLGRKLLTQVRDIMHSGERLPLVLANASLKEVVSEISHKGLGLVAVVDATQTLLGIITDADLRHAFESDADLRSFRAKDIMNSTPKVINVACKAIEALELIDKYNIRALVVVDDNSKAVGAFHMHDLFKAKLI
jgi:arabinose-5-phosphate isomerase